MLMAESLIRMDTHHENRDIQLHFKLLGRKINFKKSDRNIWTPNAEWHTLLRVNLFEMSSLSFAKGQWQQCQFINGLLIYPFFNTELNQPTGQVLKHNHHSDPPPHTSPTFHLWYPIFGMDHVISSRSLYCSSVRRRECQGEEVAMGCKLSW